MRNELQHIEQIEKYLNGEMTQLETQAFEQSMAKDSELAEQVNTQQLVMQAAVRKAIKADIAKYATGGSSGFKWSKWLSITTGVIIVAIIAYFTIAYVMDTFDKKYDPQISAETISENNLGVEDTTPVDHKQTLSDSANSHPPIDTLKSISKNTVTPSIFYKEDTECGGLKTWVEPDRQFTKIDPKKGATIEGKEGTLIIVPSDAFLDEEGKTIAEPVDLELVEALKVSDMLAYNLTTMNDDQSLQSGGMLYLQPRVDGKEVFINPERPLYIEVPTNDYNPDMKAWKGEVDENGNINWTAPKELEKYLTIVDFELLDFLPTGFEEAVEAGMPFKGHKVASKDLVNSLYYSLGIDVSSNSLNKSESCNTFDEAYFFSGELMPMVKNNFVINIRCQDDTPVSGAFLEILNSGKSYLAQNLNSQGSVILNEFPAGAFQIKICQEKQVTYFNNVHLKENTPNNFALYLPEENPEFGNRVVAYDRKTKSDPFSSINVRTFEINEKDLSFSSCDKCDLENTYDSPNFKDGEANASITLKLIDENYAPLRYVTCDLRIGNYSVFSSVSDKNGNINFPAVISGSYQLKTCDGQNTSYINDFKIRKGSNPITPIMPFIDPTQLKEMQWGKRVLCALENNKTKQTLLSNDPSCFISPQSIQTIKTDQFAKTFLSTKEFEQRLKILHQMPNAQALFDLYVNNLEKNLWEVDEMVAEKLSGANQNYFNEFAAEKLTNVKDVDIYQDQLSEYYNEKKKAHYDAAKEANATYQKKSTEQLNQYLKDIAAYKSEVNLLTKAQNELSASLTSSSASGTTYTSSNKIGKINLPYPSKKLPKRNVTTTKSSYGTKWYSSGWVNIDAYLKTINNGEKTVTINVNKNKGRVYQCINTLKAIIPLTVSGLIAKAKFPKWGKPSSTKMSSTFAIGIQREGDQLQFAQVNYNPYKTSKVDLIWEKVSSAELKEKLMFLDGTGPLLEDIKQQEEYIQKQLAIKQKREELEIQKEIIKKEINDLESKVNDIKAKLAKERAFTQSLEKVINKCGISFPITVTTESDILDVADVMPEFPGGFEYLYKYLGSNIIYPQEAIDNNIQGKVFVQFTVDESGQILNPFVIKSDSQVLNEEALRIVQSMPNWNPGMNAGTAVKVRYTLPINFILE